MSESDIRHHGLTDAQVEESRRQYGVNILTPAEKVPLWKQFLNKFTDPLIIILLVAGLLSIGISIYEYTAMPGKDMSVFFEPIGIFIAILLATGLAFFFELKADREFSLLNKVNDDEPVQVIRNGNMTRVPRKDIVVGDIIILNSGEEIPADATLLEAGSLSVDESSLTGEPICSKTTDPALFDPEATFPSDHVLRGTKVMEGHGVARVTAVGDNTENGKVFQATRIDNSVKTPLNEQLDRLGRLITRISYIVAATVIAGRLAMYIFNASGPLDWVDLASYLMQTVMIAVALIVMSVPEGLPMAVTLSLAYSMRRMLKTNNLVRKMHACETMGATTVICTDKTGTLTQNRMQVYRTNFYGLPDQKLGDDAVSRLVEDGIAANSTAELDFSDPDKPQVLGNPTEGALLLWLRDNGVDYRSLQSAFSRVSEIPFSTERKFMATVVRDSSGAETLFVKGAPEIVMDMCDSIDGGTTADTVRSQLAAYQGQAMRTLAFAFKRLKPGEQAIADNRIVTDGLTLLGIVAISDPVRSDVPAAVAECLNAGIAIKIVTGDTPGTAKEIGRQIGLWNDATDTDRNIITGPEFAALSDKELEDRVLDLKIIARARPLDKKRLVETLQKKGQIVAVTGDGTNDAPALKAAHVGLSMGDGTSVAKEASDITIVDNSFASIGRAVMWGRSLYRNIQRFVLFQMTVNITACLTVLVGSFMGMDSPLTVTQMLWVNLIMDTFAAMALASLPPSHSVMKEKPRDRRAFIINPAMWRSIIITGILMFAFLIGLLYVFEHMDIASMTDLAHISLGAPDPLTPVELSMFFSIFVFLQFWNLFNARAFATGKSALDLRGCGEFELIALIILAGQILIVSIGGEFFNVTHLSVTDWIIIIVGTSPVLWIGEILRLIKK